MSPAHTQNAATGPSAFCGGATVFVVTVTYGARQSLLQRMLAGLAAQGVAKAVIVDNGASWPVSPTLTAQYGPFVDVVAMGRNAGSAGGYTAGIQRAIDAGAELVWLLDDDNEPVEGCLARLMEAYADEARTTPCDRLAVLAFRPDHQADVAAGVPVRYMNARPDSFCGFHVLDIPYKLWRRTPWGRPHGKTPSRVRLDVAPYSGLLMHRELLRNIGVPDQRLVLYADDTEYSWRITARGGRIVLVTAAQLTDLEQSWGLKARFPTSFAGWLDGGANLRAYYAMRNQTYVDLCVRCYSKRTTTINRVVYRFILWLHARNDSRQARYALLDRAMVDGRAARLGVAPEFPLP